MLQEKFEEVDNIMSTRYHFLQLSVPDLVVALSSHKASMLSCLGKGLIMLTVTTTRKHSEVCTKAWS